MRIELASGLNLDFGRSIARGLGRDLFVFGAKETTLESVFGDVGCKAPGLTLVGLQRCDSLAFSAPLLDLRFVHRLIADVV
jgi:hypothetical protein